MEFHYVTRMLTVGSQVWWYVPVILCSEGRDRTVWARTTQGNCLKQSKVTVGTKLGNGVVPETQNGTW